MSEVDEHVDRMADLWISFDQDWATFLMCYLLIADKIKQKSNASVSISGTELLCAIRDCEQSRLTAQMSGFETGWEHPTTQTMWQRVVTLSNYIQHNA